MKNLFVSNLLLCATIVGACKSDNGGDEPDPLGPLPDGYYTIAVQPDDQQEVKGWGIYPGHVTGTHVNANNSINAATEARRVLFKELGITMYRVCLEPMCGENYTASNKALSEKYLDDLAALINYAGGEGFTEYLISIWSAPYHMKEVYDAGSGDNHNYRPRLKINEYDLFVSYVADVLRYLHNKGCPLPTALSLQNEPDGGVVKLADDIGYSTAYIDGLDLMDLLGKMRAALNAAGMSSVKLGAPESPSYEGSWIFKWNNSGVALTAKLLEPVDIHMIHSYAGEGDVYNDYASYQAPLDEFLDFKRKIGGDSWQTEFSVAGSSGQGKTVMERLQFAMRIFSADMVWAGHNVWMWWCGWFPGWSIDNSDQQILIGGGLNGAAIRKSAMFDAFATIFNNVPKGSHVRKVVTSDLKHKTNRHIMNDLVAFQTANGTFVLLVNGADKERNYRMSGLAGATGTLKSISGADAKTVDTSDFTVTGGMVDVPVPGNSVNFICTKK